MSSKHERRRRERPRVIEGSNVSQGELERKEPGVSLEFFGWSHAPLDIQTIPQIKASLQEHNAHANGPTVIYIETGHATPEMIAKAKNVASQVGYQGAVLFPYMLSESGRQPTTREIEERKRRIANSPLPIILADRLLAFENISPYFVGGVVDEVLSKNKHVRIDFEAHTPRVKERIDNTQEKRHRITRQLKWGSRDLSSALEMYLTSIEINMEVDGLRKPEIVNDLASKVQSLRQRGGTFFLLFGSAHEDIPEDVQKRADPQHKFISINARHTPNFSHYLLVIEAMKRGEWPSDEMLGRAFFAFEGSKALDGLFLNGRGDLQGFAENWQTFETSVEEVASSLSIKEIRSLNDTKEPILKVLFAHPAARVVLPYLH